MDNYHSVRYSGQWFMHMFRVTLSSCFIQHLSLEETVHWKMEKGRHFGEWGASSNVHENEPLQIRWYQQYQTLLKGKSNGLLSCLRHACSHLRTLLIELQLFPKLKPTVAKVMISCQGISSIQDLPRNLHM